MKYIANPVEVNAEIIIDVSPLRGDGAIELTLQGGSKFTADKGMCARYIPKEGDYVVTQSDGYVYLNPKEVFERKYDAA